MSTTGDPNSSLVGFKFTEPHQPSVECEVLETTSWDNQMMWVRRSTGEVTVRSISVLKTQKSAA